MATSNQQSRSMGSQNLGAEYTPEEIEFLRAIDHFKRERRRPYPTWIEVLNVLRGLGWRKVVPQQQEAA